MPGPRLTRQDRALIAEALADGLAFAEIARRLDRPTSTVSREVGRNGGPHGYRADSAHQATERRARQRKRGRSTTPPSPIDVHGRDPDAVRRFEERFTEVIVGTGLPRMAARVLTCLYTSDAGSLTAAELIGWLRVSAASVSKAVGYLEGLRLVRREREPRGRRERYVIDDDVWARATAESARVNALWWEAARHGAEVLGPSTPAGARLLQTASFFDSLGHHMEVDVAIDVAQDALTVLAALAHVARPLTADALAAGLGWPVDRVTAALGCAAEHPGITGAAALRQVDCGAYTVGANLVHLTHEQRAAMERVGAALE